MILTKLPVQPGGLAVVLITCLCCFLYDASIARHSGTNTMNALVTYKKNLEDAIVNFDDNNKNMMMLQDKKKQNLTQVLQDQRHKYFEQLKRDYGTDNFENLFLDSHSRSIGRSTYTSPHGLSWNRLQRKFLLKILHAKLLGNSKARLVWATGGHSSSAGHGNFLSESYTAVLERTMTPIFASVGIDFVARPYAMGGTSSAEEVALCMDQIFGQDIDLLSWDFGMLEPRKQEWKQLLYTYHTALGRNRPAAIGIDMKGGKREEIHSELEQLGMTVFYENEAIVRQMKEALPDSLELTQDEIDQMPPFVKQLKCGKGIESGGFCGTEKYTKTDCHVNGRVKWHPGWKMHALSGNSISLFLIEVLLDAVQEVDAAISENKDLQALFNQHDKEEENDYNNVLSSPLTDKLGSIAIGMMAGNAAADFGNMNLLELFKRRSFCHTALLPSEFRYKGLLNPQYNQTGSASFDPGMPKPGKKDPIDKENNDGNMKLVYEPGERQTCPSRDLNIDFKDFYYLTSLEGPKKLILPNNESKQHYNVDPSNMLGMIMMCLTVCPFGKCPQGDLGGKTLDTSNLIMSVNGEPVQEFSHIDVCWALKGEQNDYRWTPNSDGQFEIEAQVLQDSGFAFLRISSFILI